MCESVKRCCVSAGACRGKSDGIATGRSAVRLDNRSMSRGTCFSFSRETLGNTMSIPSCSLTHIAVRKERGHRLPATTGFLLPFKHPDHVECLFLHERIDRNGPSRTCADNGYPFNERHGDPPAVEVIAVRRDMLVTGSAAEMAEPSSREPSLLRNFSLDLPGMRQCSLWRVGSTWCELN